MGVCGKSKKPVQEACGGQTKDKYAPRAQNLPRSPARGTMFGVSSLVPDALMRRTSGRGDENHSWAGCSWEAEEWWPTPGSTSGGKVIALENLWASMALTVTGHNRVDGPYHYTCTGPLGLRPAVLHCSVWCVHAVLDLTSTLQWGLDDACTPSPLPGLDPCASALLDAQSCRRGRSSHWCIDSFIA